MSKGQASFFHLLALKPIINSCVYLIVIDLALLSLDHFDARKQAFLEFEYLRVRKDLIFFVTVITSNNHWLSWRLNRSLLLYLQFNLMLIFFGEEFLLQYLSLLFISSFNFLFLETINSFLCLFDPCLNQANLITTPLT